MKFRLNIEFIISLALLVYSVWFNLNLYKLEPTAKVDPNDNNFQYGLVDRTNQMWDFAARSCPKNITYPWCITGYLVDHWVPNWAQGYNLPFYYSHIPQIAIVGSWRLLSSVLPTTNNQQLTTISLFTYYHWVIYFLLCLFPIAVFFAIRAIRLPWIIAGGAAILATHISTDGLYGIDPPSFLWRGWGLSSQLFAMLWMPIGIALSYRFFTMEDPDHTAYRKDLTNPKDVLDYLYRELTDSVFPWSGVKKRLIVFWIAVVFLMFSVMGHLGLGFMELFSVIILGLGKPISDLFEFRHIRLFWQDLVKALFRIGLLCGSVVFLLSYWIVPSFLYNNYHNISVWDPIWKFDSFGWKEIMIRLFNGDLFDWGRKPIFTVLVLTGLFVPGFLKSQRDSRFEYRDSGKNVSAVPEAQTTNPETRISNLESRNYTIHPLVAFSYLFIFWLLMYFGRTTWGKLIDLIPGMTEFHISRFIVGVHLAGIFSAAMTMYFAVHVFASVITKFFTSKKTVSPTPLRIITIILSILFLLVVAPPIYKQTIYYNELNDRLIKQGNANYDKDIGNINALFAEIRKLPPARVFVGRGGGWGKDFRIAETEMFMHISTHGIPTALWLPETWSPNSDTEQYFSEDQAKDYDLYNLKYIAAPPSVKPQPFWTLLTENPAWKLYETKTTGYFTLGKRTMAVVTKKTDFVNLVHAWIQSKIPENRLFPQMAFKKSEVIPSVPVITMVNEVDYLTNNGIRQNIYANNPLYGGEAPKATLKGPEKVDSDMVFSTFVTVEQDCKECYVILKQTYHPNWKAWVNGKAVKPINVFPFFVAVPLDHPGTSEIVVAYKPSGIKMTLLAIALLSVLAIVILWIRNRKFVTKQ